MKKLALILVAAVVAGSGYAFYSGAFTQSPAGAGAQPGGGPGGPGGPGGRPGGGRNFGRQPMTVELTSLTRGRVTQQLTVVGNLIGDATVSVVPKTAGRLDAVYVRLGDKVSMGQKIAKIEDREILEQVKQAEAAFEVGKATIRQREADLKFAQTNLDRSKSLFDRQLLPRQTMDDADARFQASQAQLDLARAQVTQLQARLDELRINLANTIIVSPVNGFVARRATDPGAYASPNAPVADLVDIHRVRLVANVIEKDLRRVQAGDAARVEVDAYPGETFTGRVARVAPVLDPTTRTAEIEVEIPNGDYRLKPGMYARVSVTTDESANALVVSRNAVVNIEGQRGVFVENALVATFHPVEIGIEDGDRVEVLAGVTERDRIITTGAAALRDGDRVLLPGRGPGGGAGGPGGPGGRRPGGTGPGAPAAGAPRAPRAAGQSPGA